MRRESSCLMQPIHEAIISRARRCLGTNEWRDQVGNKDLVGFQMDMFLRMLRTHCDSGCETRRQSNAGDLKLYLFAKFCHSRENRSQQAECPGWPCVDTDGADVTVVSQSCSLSSYLSLT
jgi:hypothetical protein